jgi:hypothetical protein
VAPCKSSQRKNQELNPISIIHTKDFYGLTLTLMGMAPHLGQHAEPKAFVPKQLLF